MDHSLLIDDDPNQWTATLEFEVHEPLFPIQNVMPHEIENAPLVRIDILKFLHPIWRGTKIYFSPRKYPSTFGFDRSKNWPSLLFDLKLAARQAGYDICSRGWSNKRQKEYRRRLQCSMSIPYAGKKDKEEIQSYKTHQDICDSLSNDGPQNKKSTRRRTTNRPLHRCDACKFFFNIGRDESGAFFLMGGKGNDLHNDHAYGTTEKIKLLIKDRMKPDTTFKIFYGDHLEDLHNPRFILGYWSIRGLGAPLRMMLSAAETNHWAVLYDMEEKEDGSWGCESFMKDKVW